MRTFLLIAAALLLATDRAIGTKALAVGLSGLLVLAMVVPQPAVAQFDLFGAITELFNSVNRTANNILSFITDTIDRICLAAAMAG